MGFASLYPSYGSGCEGPSEAQSRQIEAAMTGAITAKTDAPGAHDPQAAPLKLEEFLPYQLNVVASLVSQALSRIYSHRYGIDVPHWRILVTLGQYETMTAKAIGAHSHMHKTKVSRAVGEL
jgi:hypothetical protein